jgi:hypothetical protein
MSKHKNGIIMLVFFAFSALMYILFLIGKSFPRYQSLSELNYLPYLLIVLTILSLGITHAVAEYLIYQKYRSTQYLILGVLASLMILAAVVFMMISHLISEIYVPEPPLNADIETLYAFYLDKIEIQQRAQNYHSTSRLLLLIGLAGIFFSRPLLGNNKVKQVLDSKD